MNLIEAEKHITVDLERCSGDPTIDGSRLRVTHLVGMVRAEDSIEAVLDGFPWLTKESILAAQIWLSANPHYDQEVMPSSHQKNPGRAMASVRRKLWEHLGLGEFDGTSYREHVGDQDRIVLSLRPSILRTVERVLEWDGFPVRYKVIEPAQAHQVGL